MGRTSHHPIRYVPALDGVRAIAILGVMIVHAAPAALPGGFTGVDVFFVLSGFLITAIIINDFRHGTFSLWEFYLRRIQRLLPNLLLMVASMLLLWRLLLPPSMSQAAGKQALWTLAYVSNIFVWRQVGDYWGPTAEGAAFTHTWSLGIEEQFYLLFPLLLLAMMRLLPRRTGWSLAVGAGLSLSVCIRLTEIEPVQSYYRLPSRGWELLLGALLAVWWIGQDRNDTARGSTRHFTSEWCGWAGLALVFGGFGFIHGAMKFPGSLALVPAVGAALLLVGVVNGDTVFARSLGAPWIVYVGKLSYSLYLWHWPLTALGRNLAAMYGHSTLAGALGGEAVSVALAWAAYTWVELPFRSRSTGSHWRWTAVILGYGVALALSFGFVSDDRVVDFRRHFDPIGQWPRSMDYRRPPIGEDGPPKSAVPVADAQLIRKNAAMWRDFGAIHAYGGGAPKVVVFGSSHAIMYAPIIDTMCHDRRIPVAFYCLASTGPFFEPSRSKYFPSRESAQGWTDARRSVLREWRPEVLFIIHRWDDDPADFAGRLTAFLREASPFVKRIVFVTQVPVIAIGEYGNLPEFAAWRMDRGEAMPVLYPDDHAAIRDATAATAEAVRAEFPNLQIIHADRYFLRSDGSVRYAEGRKFFYINGSHLDKNGAEAVRDLFDNVLASVHGSKP